MATGLKAAVGNYSMDYINSRTTVTPTIFTGNNAIVNPAGTIAGISSGSTTILPNRIISNSGNSASVVFTSIDPYPNQSPVIPTQRSSVNAVSSTSNYNGAFKTQPDITNQAQNMFSAKVSNSLTVTSGGINNAVDIAQSNSIFNNGSNGTAGSLTSTIGTIDNMLGNGTAAITSPTNINSQISRLFPGIKLPGQTSILNNNESSLIAEQASKITLPTDVIDGIVTQKVGDTKTILTAAQLREKSLLETGVTQGVAQGVPITSNSALQAASTAATNAVSAVGDAVNMPGSAASVASANSALGGAALASKVKEVEGQLNAVQANALAAINNPIKKVEGFVQNKLEGIAANVSVDLAAPAVSAALDAASAKVKTLIGGIPFIGASLTSLSVTQLEQKLGTYGTQLFNWASSSLEFIGQEIASLFATQVQSQVIQSIDKVAAEVAAQQLASLAASSA